MDVTRRIELDYWIEWDDLTDSFLACCPQIDLFTQARSESRAKRAIEMAIICFLGHCHSKGSLYRVLDKY